ncbi:hypothetical protein C8J27_10735 [Rhodobacter aestuarii]|uniref:Uncharacterized protein n=1 Tax=Rhodobacter aestuarii TaxID=453582 RepID=A0A1N7NWN6_9RHOB|nr:hypothetical protein [Rhodobacter aestuarii]PTV94504.1 hypothetical protein C8J27_10735 [Rhodobacter aestuarii]SIT02696.1 hypothetical protein SAMN05421580_108192 [Rhodobacter aestuarii]
MHFRQLRSVVLGAALVALMAVPAAAQDVVGAYVAYIGTDDLFNSRGQRLSAPWQVLRQDRANFHKFGLSQPGDEWDPFFGDVNNRAAMERMVMNGSIEPAAARKIMAGGATVFVRIYGYGSRGDYVRVTVTR